jgi:lysyl-tRNA synthetase, class II
VTEQEIIRREKLQKILDAGFEAYPAALYPVSHLSLNAKHTFEANTNEPLEVCIAGRIMIKAKCYL